MGKVFKYTSVFMLCLAVFIFCAHMIIPHDHHSAAAFSDLDGNCPLSHETWGHHSRLPEHCHAFNDLIAEKHNLLVLRDGFHHNIITLTGQNNELSSEVQSPSVLFIYQESLPDSNKPGSSRFRAPPALA